MVESYCDFEELTPTAINEFISKIVVHERDVKRAKYAVQRIEVYFNYIGRFENELTKQIEPTEQEMIQVREEIEEAKKEKSRAYHKGLRANRGSDSRKNGMAKMLFIKANRNLWVQA